MLKRVLIANRGEIAVRIVRAAASLGIESVAVCSPADALSLHTRMATVARAIGDANDALGPYLDAKVLIEAAIASGCDSIHPGYGFLSESADFATRTGAAGLVFVGPSPGTLALFGDKTKAKKLALSLNIPVVPGSGRTLESAADALAVAGEIGYPVMLKAAFGGGGRGMRRIEQPSQMEEGFARASSEAQSAFGNGALFLEKIVARTRHIEVQILADARGNTIHLRERDCSVQLRHQKVIEMAPAPELDAALREKILTDAVKLARASEFANAGTIEFLVEPEDNTHYFIEGNPRIQVEIGRAHV